MATFSSCVYSSPMARYSCSEGPALFALGYGGSCVTLHVAATLHRPLEGLLLLVKRNYKSDATHTGAPGADCISGRLENHILNRDSPKPSPFSFDRMSVCVRPVM